MPATRVIVEHRELLFRIVYNILGSVADTEDVVQETWPAWASRNRTADTHGAEDTAHRAPPWCGSASASPRPTERR